ncbi:MAG TPA: hypothetical protein VNK23_06865 [Candidatus Dormibacteraeota bacterium]|nr:hypothetical protein [Candidatus Dormibacteraeota bacterium]
MPQPSWRRLAAEHVGPVLVARAWKAQQRLGVEARAELSLGALRQLEQPVRPDRSARSPQALPQAWANWLEPAALPDARAPQLARVLRQPASAWDAQASWEPISPRPQRPLARPAAENVRAPVPRGSDPANWSASFSR